MKPFSTIFVILCAICVHSYGQILIYNGPVTTKITGMQKVSRVALHEYALFDLNTKEYVKIIYSGKGKAKAFLAYPQVSFASAIFTTSSKKAGKTFEIANANTSNSANLSYSVYIGENGFYNLRGPAISIGLSTPTILALAEEEITGSVGDNTVESSTGTFHFLFQLSEQGFNDGDDLNAATTRVETILHSKGYSG